MKTNDFVNTVFKSNKIVYDVKDNDCRFVRSIESIPKGHIVLLEHCLTLKAPTQNLSLMANAISYSPTLYNELYPRNLDQPWDEKLIEQHAPDDLSVSIEHRLRSETFFKLCEEKARQNAFAGPTLATMSLGLDVSRFNHSQQPNIAIKYSPATLDEEDGVYCDLVCVYALHDIPANTELFLYYGDVYNNLWKLQNPELASIPTPIPSPSRPSYKIDHEIIRKMHLQYYQKPEEINVCKEILFNQFCFIHGLVVSDDVLYHTPEFDQLFLEETNHQQECCQETIVAWMREKRHMCHYRWELD